MKWVALGVCLALILPLAFWLRTNPHHRLKFWMALGFLPFVIDYYHLYMAIYSQAQWGGYVKGAEFSVLDIVALILYFGLPPARHSIPFRLAMALYVVATVLSAFQALFPTMTLLYSWQLARMFLVYATVTKGCLDQRVTWAIMQGMGAAIIMEMGLVLWQRFGLHLIQTGGTLGHPNLLGLMSHLVILPFFALLLAERRGLFPWAVLLAGAITNVSTASRATIAFAALGFVSILVLSAAASWTPRKKRAVLAVTLMMGVMVPIAITSLQDRFTAIPLTEDVYDEREAYKDAAASMISDHPMGVGANSFAVIGNIKKYFELAGVASVSSSRAGNVHNIYYLVTAETGYFGLATLLVLLLSPVFVAFRCWWRNRADSRGNSMLGFGLALVIVYCHSWFEWTLAAFSAQYLLAIVMGLIAGNARALGYWARNGAAVGPQLSNKLFTASS